MVSLLTLHLVLGIGIIAVGRALGRRAFLVAAIPPLATVIWACVNAADVLDGRAVTQSFAWVEQLGITIMPGSARPIAVSDGRPDAVYRPQPAPWA